MQLSTIVLALFNIGEECFNHEPSLVRARIGHWHGEDTESSLSGTVSVIPATRATGNQAIVGCREVAFGWPGLVQKDEVKN